MTSPDSRPEALPEPGPVRVVVVDDELLVRVGVRSILERSAGIAVIGEAGNGTEAVALCAQTRPDVVLMDLRMPGLDGIGATRQIVGRSESGLRVLVLTTFDLDEQVYAALKAGASGFLTKDTPPEQLADAVRAAAQGDTLLAPRITRRLVEAYTRAPAPNRTVPESLDGLSPRELEVLGQIALGHSNARIAATLFLSEATVKSHVTRILSKLDITDRVQAVIIAYESGLVRPGDRRG